MEATERHQGFANYATFSIGVTLDNDRVGRDHVERLLAETESAEVPDVALADALRDMVERLPAVDDAATGASGGGLLPNELAGLLRSSIVSAGLAEVDWLDLARYYRRRES